MRQLAEADRLISSPDHNRRRDRFRPRVTSGSNLANYGNILTSIDYVCSQTSSGALPRLAFAGQIRDRRFSARAPRRRFALLDKIARDPPAWRPRRTRFVWPAGWLNRAMGSLDPRQPRTAPPSKRQTAPICGKARARECRAIFLNANASGTSLSALHRYASAEVIRHAGSTPGAVCTVTK
jgi:hypothetical protein